MSPFHLAIYFVILSIIALPFVVIGAVIAWAVRKRRSRMVGVPPREPVKPE